MGNRGGSAVFGRLPDASGLTGGGIINVRLEVRRKPAGTVGSEAETHESCKSVRFRASGEILKNSSDFRSCYHTSLFSNYCLFIRGGMQMNKRCTNSSCRKTFSTLGFDGKCPHCGKRYPQLINTRKHGYPSYRYINICVKKKPQFRISLDQVLALLAAGRKFDGIKRFREEVRMKNFNPDLRSSKEFCEALMAGERPCAVWYLTSEKRDDLPIITAASRRG